MKGALRIRKISLKDSGKYTCVSGYSKADIYITVKPLPPRIDDERTVESLNPNPGWYTINYSTKLNIELKLVSCGHHKTFFYINVVH